MKALNTLHLYGKMMKLKSGESLENIFNQNVPEVGVCRAVRGSAKKCKRKDERSAYTA